MRPAPRLLALLVAGLVAVGCSPAASVSPTPTATPIVLRVAPDNLGCDAVGFPWKLFTIRINPLIDGDQVWAVTDTGQRMNTFWSRGFVGGTSEVPVIVGPNGQVVARDGEQIVVPEDGQWPRLHGYMVCPGSDAIYILLQDPS
jgi:hypothetical protein